MQSYSYQGEIHVPEGREYWQDYLQFPFEVPAGTGEVRLRLAYTPQKVRGITNLITLGLYDPHGFRGNAHRQPPDREVHVSVDTATVGFLAGPLPPGQWLAQLALQAVVADSHPCRYSLEIELLSEDAKTARPAQEKAPASKSSHSGPGWLRGELHSHTLHSDGALTTHQLIELAQQQGLDFLAVTDHNTVSALREVHQESLNGLVIIPGMELTTFCGHALALGISEWVDWRTGYRGWTMNDAARETHRLGGLFIVAHPFATGNPFCTGCRWEYPEFDFALADALEIWNDRWISTDNDNSLGLALWRDLQTQPRHFPATAGADFHGPKSWGPGSPRTYIYAENHSAQAILEGVRQGRVMISSGPMLKLQIAAHDDQTPGEIGDTVRIPGRHCRPHIAWEGAPSGSRVVLRGRQGELYSGPAEANGSVQPHVTVQAHDDRLWVELYGQDHLLLAITNPVFVQTD